jgi:hypothetical protein
MADNSVAYVAVYDNVNSALADLDGFGSCTTKTWSESTTQR